MIWREKAKPYSQTIFGMEFVPYKFKIQIYIEIFIEGGMPYWAMTLWGRMVSSLTRDHLASALHQVPSQ